MTELWDTDDYHYDDFHVCRNNTSRAALIGATLGAVAGAALTMAVLWVL